jgi:hypothetical protein
MAATATHVYVLGGSNTTHCSVGSVFVAPILADGRLGAWAPTTALTVARNLLGAAVVGKWLYVVGGISGCDLVGDPKSAAVERAEILPDGTLGPWVTAAPLTQARAHMPVVSDGLHLYAVGGFDETRTNTVEMSTVLPDGALTPWQLVAPMTSGRESAAVAVIGGTLYAAGGLGGGILASSEGATVLSDGTLAPWQPMAAMSVPRYQAAGAAVGGTLVATGGTPNGTVFNSTEGAVLDGAGTITSWLPEPPTQTARNVHAAAARGTVIYVAGGVSNAGGLPVVETSVEFASVAPPDGDLGKCQTDLAQAQAEIQALQGQIMELNNQISALSQQNQALREQVATVTQQYQTMNSGLQYGLGGVEQAMQQAFNNSQFHIPGATPLLQFQSLVNAILGVNRGQLLGLYMNLTGK